MFHSIVKNGRPIRANTDISEVQFQEFVNYAKTLDFHTITTDQLINFLLYNALIPERSMILIVDDRRPGVIRDYFLPVLKKNDWTVTLGWIIADTYPGLWAEMENMNATGYLDVQSHGYWHRYMDESAAPDVIHEEIFGPIPVLEQHFGHRPLAFVWPGGNFTPSSVRTARDAGYQLGFTAFSRGPLMYDWVPLGEPEEKVGDPLMVLPRLWSTAGSVALDQAVAISEEARAFAEQNRSNEEDWYRAACK